MVDVEVYSCRSNRIGVGPGVASEKLGNERRGSVAAAYRCWLRKREVVHSSQPTDSFFFSPETSPSDIYGEP